MTSRIIDGKRYNGIPPSTTPLLRRQPGELETAINRRTRILFYLRFLVFVLIEVAFISLATICLANPILLNTTLQLMGSEVKGGFTVLFIVWQGLATIAGGYILADAFSREWSVHLEQIVPGTTDRVSTITSGFLDRFLYLFTRRASGTFKLAFFTSLSLMALTQLAPGTISVTTALVHVPTTVRVGSPLPNITIVDLANVALFTTERASLIIRLDQIEHSPFGLDLPPNQLVALPSVNLTDLSDGVLEYKSDVVDFRHDCHWEAPSFVNDTDLRPSVVAAGQHWYSPLVFGTGIEDSAFSISPLSLTTDQLMENINITATLFIGVNSTFPGPQVPSVAIDLDTLPSTSVPTGIGVIIEGLSFIGPLASVLICDPRPNISGGHIQLSDNGRTINIIDSGRPPIGDFSPSTANLIFTNVLQGALAQSEPITEPLNAINSVASIMFMANHSVNQNPVPLDIASINKNMDAFVLSGAKAFLDGYRRHADDPYPTFDLVSIPAISQKQRFVLVTSKKLFIITIVLATITIGLLFALCWATLSLHRCPFDLNGVFAVIQEGKKERAPMYAPQQRVRMVRASR